MERESDPVARELGIVLALSAFHRAADADHALLAFIEEHGESLAFYVAVTHAGRGDTDQAFLWLDRAYEQRDPFLAEILLAPLLASLKSNPRWPAFLDKMGLPH